MKMFEKPDPWRSVDQNKLKWPRTSEDARAEFQFDIADPTTAEALLTRTTPEPLEKITGPVYKRTEADSIAERQANFVASVMVDIEKL